MLKYAFIVLFLFAGCTSGFEYWDYDYEYEEEFVEIGEAFYWVWHEIKYEKDPENNWKLPHETAILLTGDCEDQSLLFADIVYRYLGRYPILLKIRDGEKFHIVVKVDGVIYDPTNSCIRKDDLDIKEFYTYGRAMFIALVR